MRVIPLMSAYVAVLAAVAGAFSFLVSTPYMDEPFHLLQTQAYCHGRFDEWDEKITTFPGLYVCGVLVAWAGAVLRALEDGTLTVYARTGNVGVRAVTVGSGAVAAAADASPPHTAGQPTAVGGHVGRSPRSGVPSSCRRLRDSRTPMAWA